MPKKEICGTCGWHHLVYCTNLDNKQLFVTFGSPACEKWKKKQVVL